MFDIFAVVVDAARARFFRDEHVSPPARFGGSATNAPSWEGRRLQEKTVLVNPEGRLADEEQLTETKPGTARGPAGQTHSYNDHRDARRDELDRKFAAEVVSHAEKLLKEHDARRLVVTADPRMLGFLRQHLPRLERLGITVRDLGKDVSKMPPDQIRKVLEKNDLLPWEDDA